MSDNWYYSTELRVVNTQLISAFLFRLTDNWQLVRILTAIILYLVCGGAVAFLGKSLKLDNINIVLCEFLLLVPYSIGCLFIVQFGMFYYPHIILMFLALGCLLYSREKRCYVLFWLILSFVMGLGGLRYLLILHIPAFCVGSALAVRTAQFTDFLNTSTRKNARRYCKTDEIHRLITITGGCILADGGYLINTKVLSEKYTFQSFQNLKYSNLGGQENSIFDICGRVMMGIPEIMGFRYDVRLISVQGIVNIIVILLVLVVLTVLCVQTKKVFQKDSRKDYVFSFLLLLLVFSFLANVYIFIFTGNYSPRYWIPVFVWLVPITALVFNGNENTSNILRQRKLSLWGVICFALMAGICVLTNAIGNDGSMNRYAVNQYLESQNVNVGYSTFWNANVTTEMTNGRIKMFSINSENDLNPYKWLTPKDFYYEDRQTSKDTFILLSREEAERIQDISK